MSGIYIHIPFCKQQCSYCDFHFSTSLKTKNDVLDALVYEMQHRAPFFEGTKIRTIYLGGGTPTLLSANEINTLLEHLNNHFDIDQVEEITIEANPDDLTSEKIKDFKNTPINRFSIGVQSFHSDDLVFMNRAHNAFQAKKCIKDIQEAGWENISIDLIYGTPTLSHEKWIENLTHIIDFDIPHLSAYALTVEEKTPLHHAIKSGKQRPLDEKKCQEQFEILLEMMPYNGLIQYEISNFSKTHFESKHNTSYWQQKKYLGLGPSAHSFDGKKRMWNVSNNVKYIQSLKRGELNYENEILSETDHFNEYVMTAIRTKMGCDTNFIKTHFSPFYGDFFKKNTEKWIKKGQIEQKNSFFVLTKKGQLMADLITSNLFFVD